MRLAPPWSQFAVRRCLLSSREELTIGGGSELLVNQRFLAMWQGSRAQGGFCAVSVMLSDSLSHRQPSGDAHDVPSPEGHKLSVFLAQSQQF